MKLENIYESLGINKSYSCVKCGNRDEFRITINNEWSDLYRGSMSLYGKEHIISKDYILKCKVCNYEIIIHKEM